MVVEIVESLRSLYLNDKRPWVVGYSGGKDSTMLVSLVIRALMEIPRDKRTKDVSIVCTDTRVEVPAVVERVNTELEAMKRCSKEFALGVTTHLQSPSVTQSCW